MLILQISRLALEGKPSKTNSQVWSGPVLYKTYAYFEQ